MPQSENDLRRLSRLTKEDFAEACHHFDRRYLQSSLGPLRKRWKLRVCTALDTCFSGDAEYAVYIQITRPLEATLDHDDLSFHIEKFSFSDGSRDEELEEDVDMARVEDSDEVAKPAPGNLSSNKI